MNGYTVAQVPQEISEITEHIRVCELIPEDAELLDGLARNALGYGNLVKENHDNNAFYTARLLKENFEMDVTRMLTERGITDDIREIIEYVASFCYNEGYSKNGNQTVGFNNLLDVLKEKQRHTRLVHNHI